jgi:hypothetical protein
VVSTVVAAYLTRLVRQCRAGRAVGAAERTLAAAEEDILLGACEMTLATAKYYYYIGEF